jgi:hypothetical protein
MHMRMHTTNRAGLRFGLARRRPRQILRSPSVPESKYLCVERKNAAIHVILCVQW